MNGRKRWKENEDKKQQMKTHLEISKLKAVVYTIPCQCNKVMYDMATI
jgi:hypothetical protein